VVQGRGVGGDAERSGEEERVAMEVRIGVRLTLRRALEECRHTDRPPWLHRSSHCTQAEKMGCT